MLDGRIGETPISAQAHRLLSSAMRWCSPRPLFARSAPESRRLLGRCLPVVEQSEPLSGSGRLASAACAQLAQNGRDVVIDRSV